jgi:hypothetical protein
LRECTKKLAALDASALVGFTVTATRWPDRYQTGLASDPIVTELIAGTLMTIEVLLHEVTTAVTEPNLTVPGAKPDPLILTVEPTTP